MPLFVLVFWLCIFVVALAAGAAEGASKGQGTPPSFCLSGSETEGSVVELPGTIVTSRTVCFDENAMACCGLHRVKFAQVDNDTPDFAGELSKGRCKRLVAPCGRQPVKVPLCAEDVAETADDELFDERVPSRGMFDPCSSGRVTGRRRACVHGRSVCLDELGEWHQLRKAALRGSLCREKTVLWGLLWSSNEDRFDSGKAGPVVGAEF